MSDVIASSALTPAALAPPRVSVLDPLRGLAALSVAWFHLTNTYPEDSWVRASGAWGWVGVEFFFVISGFIIPWTMHWWGYRLRADWPRFIVKRLVRLEPPFFVSVLVCLAVAFVAAHAPGYRGERPDISLPQLLSHFGYLTGVLGYNWLNIVYWTLAIEFQFYIVMALTFAIWLRTSSNVFLLAGIALSAVPVLLGVDWGVVNYWPLFLLGMAACRFRIRKDSAPIFVSASLLAGLMLVVVHGPAVAMAGIAATTLIAWPPSWLDVPVLRFLGGISFSLYLLHVPIGGRAVNLLRRLGEGEGWYAGISLVALAVSLLSAYVLWRLVERHSLAWASRIRFGSKRQQSKDPAGIAGAESEPHLELTR
jgi:peptidoglycan/LPS O-acetylase OafA/YrhL